MWVAFEGSFLSITHTPLELLKSPLCLGGSRGYRPGARAYSGLEVPTGSSVVTANHCLRGDRGAWGAHQTVRWEVLKQEAVNRLIGAHHRARRCKGQLQGRRSCSRHRRGPSKSGRRLGWGDKSKGGLSPGICVTTPGSK